MAKKIIRTGTTADPTGDSLKNAFVKVNDNFTELYNALGLDADTLNIGAFEFTGSVISTTDSSAIVIDQAATITSNLSVGGDVLPSVANGGDLGSSTLPWRSLYVSNNTIYIGGTAVGLDANGNLTTGGTIVGSTPAWANITGKPTIPTSFSSLVNGANTVSLDANGNITFPQGTLLGYSDPGGFIINGAVDKDIAIYTYNGADAHGWTFGTDGSLTLPGDIKSNGNINIEINLSDSTKRIWQFGEDGLLTFPDGTSQSTAGGAGGGSTLVNGAYTVSLGSTGTLTVPASGIITTTNNEFFKLQAKDSNSLLRNEIKLDPNNGTYMSVWSEEVETSYNTSDWATASWINEDGLGAARFTGAEDLQAFWTNGPGSFVESVEVSINGGARGLAGYENNNGGGYGVYLSVDQVPPGAHGTTVPITSLVFYYRTKNRIDIDRDGGQLLLNTQYLNINLETNSYINLKSTRENPVRIITNKNTHMWEFDSTGSLTLPREGKIYGIGDGGLGGNRYGYISWDGNSSGDGNGWNTMRLVPDYIGLEAADTYIILDPAYVDSPDSIHIRAGGTRDNSLANLCLGGVNSQVKIGAGANPPVTVKANSNSWIFGTDGGLTFPDGTKQSTAPAITIAADDSTQRTIFLSEESIKFVGAGGVTTASDAEGNITITGTAPSTLVNSTKTLSLGSDGSLTSNGALTIKTPNGIPSSVSNWVGGGGWNNPPYSNLATTGGTGTGLTVNVSAADGGYININYITIATAGTGYTAGDVITITNENSLSGTFTIGVTGTRNWAFGINGHLTLPAGGDIKDSTGTSVLGGGSSIPAVVTTGAVGVDGAAHAKVQFTVTSATTVTAVGVTAIGVTDSTKGTITLSGSPATGAFDIVAVTNTYPGEFYIFIPFATNASGTGYGAPISGEGTNPCLVRGTMITMADMSRVAVENITYSDDILVWDFDLGEFASAKPVWIKKTQTTVVSCLLTFSDHSELRIVGDSPKAHRIFNKEAGKFTYGSMPETPIGTTTFNDQGEEITLISKEWIVGEVEFYNVMTDYHMNLFANSILTSMRYNNLYPITDMKFVKDSRTLRTADDYPNVEERLYKGFRLAEQTQSVEEIETHIQWLLSFEVERETECV